MLNLRLVQPRLLVQVNRLPELTGVATDGDSVTIGACVTHTAIADGLVPDIGGGVLSRVAESIAYRAVRNRGTIGGSLCHADPAGDWVTVLMALDASVLLQGPDGPRSLRVSDFIQGAFRTALVPGEIMQAIRILRLPADARLGLREGVPQARRLRPCHGCGIAECRKTLAAKSVHSAASHCGWKAMLYRSQVRQAHWKRSADWALSAAACSWSCSVARWPRRRHEPGYAHGERRDCHGRRAAAHAPGRLSARATSADPHPSGLRTWRVRGLYVAVGWCARSLMHRLHSRLRWRGCVYDRRPGERSGHSSPARRIHGGTCTAVRVLHARHVGDGARHRAAPAGCR